MGQAIGVLDAAAKLDECPGVEAKARAGQLSVPQTQALARAVSVEPSAEPALLAVAERDGLAKLTDRCRAVGTRPPTPSRDTSASTGTIGPALDRPGRRLPPGRKLTPDAGAKLLGALAPYERASFGQARTDGATNRTKPTWPTAWWPWPRRP